MTRTQNELPRILIADDQKDVLEALRILLRGKFKMDFAKSPVEIIQAVKTRDYDVILMDLNYTRDTTSGEEGLNVLRQLQSLDETVPVIVMTAWGSIQLTVEAMRMGARDFIQKPWDNNRLLSVLRTQVQLGHAIKKGKLLEEENRILRDENLTDFIAESKVMLPVIDLIRRIGPSEANVLITGENGTGKNVVAQVIHDISARSDSPFLTVNIAGLSEHLIESELFGHVKGAFTDARSDRVGRFELADQGTLFLDEIANIPLTQQTKLLRVLETCEYEQVGSSKTRSANVRFLSATNANLTEEVQSGRFRQDLFFRLNTVEIRLPPLRERREDILLLARHFLARHCEHYRKKIDDISKSAAENLRQYPWPGNVRELDHVIERSVLMAQTNIVEPQDLGLQFKSNDPINIEDLSLEEVEKALIQKALSRYEGNVSKAAKALGLSRSGLYRRLSKHGL